MIKAAKKYFKTSVIFLCVSSGIFSENMAQENEDSTYSKEFSLYVDNDAPIAVSGFDKYYSSGIYFSYRRVLRPETSWYKLFNKKEKLSKAIVAYSFEHRFFTPEDIKDTEEEKIDRPYAGWVNLAVDLNYHFKKNSVFRIKYDLGLLGPGTKSEELQVWFHDLFGMKDPRGWKYQINNTLATNLSLSYQKLILADKSNTVDIISENSMQMGTIRNNIRSGLAFRFGRLGNLSNSLFTRSKIGAQRVDFKEIPVGQRVQEVYFFYRIQGEYVVHNTTIDGTLIGKESPFTKVSKPWVVHQEFGIGRGGRLFDFLISFHKRSREIIGNKKHHYLTIAISQRF